MGKCKLFNNVDTTVHYALFCVAYMSLNPSKKV